MARDVTISCFGLSFKANIEDFRESPALEIAVEVARTHPGNVFIVEPYLTELLPCLKGIAELKSASDAMLETDILLILVEHKLFNSIFNNVQSRCKIIDTRGVFRNATH